MIDDIQSVFDETLERKFDLLNNRSEELRFIMDSMNVLEILVALEERGYNTKFIKVDELITVSDLIRKVKDEQG